MNDVRMKLVVQTVLLAKRLHEPDPADPWRQGYTVENAVLAAIGYTARLGDPLTDDEQGLVKRMVHIQHGAGNE